MARLSASAPVAPETTPKKARLTIAQLAAYDDVLTDVLVDHVFAWHQTRKNLGPWQVRHYKHSRGVSGDDVTKILFEDVVLNKSPERALKSFLKLPGIQKYVASLGCDREKQDFTRHMQKYINIWLPECSFEVSFTNRYMIDQWEARTTARKYIKAGEKIKYLCGNLVSITMDEEEDQNFISNAFSITYSSRKKTPSLFLGPARFANHDCNANAKLENRGSEGMVVIAVRDIDEGDEINVNYGENYFGEDNCECLCLSCEKAGSGGWRHGALKPGNIQTQRAGSESDNEGTNSRRSKRKRQPINYTQRMREPKTYNEEEPPNKRRKSEFDLFPISNTSPTKVEAQKSHLLSPIKVASRSFGRSSENVDPRNAAIRAQIGKDFLRSRASSSRTETRFPSSQMSNDQSRRSSTPNRRRSFHSGGLSNLARRPPKDVCYKSHMLFAFLKRGTSNAYSEQEDRQSSARSETIVLSIETEEPRSHLSSSSSDGTSIFDRAERPSGSPFTEPSAGDTRNENAEQTGGLGTKSREKEPVASPPVSNVRERLSVPLACSSCEQISSSNPETTAPSVAPTPAQQQREPLEGVSVTSESLKELDETLNRETFSEPGDADEARKPTLEGDMGSLSESEYRVPGDYIRTDRLLGPKNSRWVDCRTCTDSFVQHEAHQTRRECPRCERHSKLYGFQWPQADYERGGPERVMDHRTVNRFLSRSEEMSEPRRRCRRGG